MFEDVIGRVRQPPKLSLRRHLILERDKRTVALADGFVADWPDYMKRVGFIAGLNEAIAMCEQAEKEND
jgi:hypothetical protein